MRQKGKPRTAVEANFVDYKLIGDKRDLTPDLKNWRNDVLTLYASWNGNNPELTLRSLVKANYPEAKYLSDIAQVQTPLETTARGMRDQTCQTTDRIYTFPIPQPSPLARESISWGEPEIKTACMSSGELWHARLGHTSDANMRVTSDTYPMFNIPKKHVTNEKTQSATCECCARCKATLKRKIKPSQTYKATKYLERVHMDVCGPLQMNTYDGCKYFTVFVDEYTKYRWVYVHQDRTTAVEILRKWIMDATKGTENKVQCLRTDQAKEHLSKAYINELRRHGIRLECSAAYDHYQNGRAEKLIRDICNMARCMLEYGKVARDMWGYAVRYAAYVQNRLVHAGMSMSPYEMRFGEAPDLTRLRIFGCTAYVARDKKETDFVGDKKLDPRGAEGCFVGMADDGAEIQGAAVKGYMVWTLETGAKTVTSNQVHFDETRYPRLMGVTEWEFALQTRVQKCKATITVMSFETETVDRHPFVFEQEELDYRTEQQRTKLNASQLVGMNVTVNHKGQLRKGKIYSYLTDYKVWGIVLTQTDEDEDGLIYVTAEQMANEDKIKFNDRLTLFKKRHLPKAGKEITDSTETESGVAPLTDDISLFNLSMKQDTDLLRYDSSIRNTDIITHRVTDVKTAKAKAPISRHEPEPKGWKTAMSLPTADKWYKAGEAEIRGLDDMKTWDVVRPVPGVKPIDSKWVFKIKYSPTGEIEKYKARLVVRGDSQRPGLDFGEVFSPVAHNTICRMLLSMAAACDFEIDLVDVCQAFLNAELQEEIYMRPAPGVCQILGVPEDSWLKLKRNLYGLKQAPRNWSLTFIDWMTKSQGFTKASIDDCLFYKEFKHEGKDVFIMLLMYVDDNIIISNDRACLDKFKADMHAKFKIVDKKDISTYLGVQVERSREAGNRWLKIHQEGYLNEVLAAMGIKKDNTLVYQTPLPANIQLVKNEGEPYELDLYRSAIGSLIYLSTWTRIDIAYAVSALAAHMSNPSRDHHVALKHLLHYLHGTRDRGITYHANDAHGINKLYGFVDADYAGDSNTRKSRSGFVMMMNSGAISWKSKLQTVVANSTTDAEVYAATLAIKEIIYLRDALRRIGLPQAVESAPHKGTILYEDNEATSAIAKSAAHREATKHMAIARAFLRYHHENGTVAITDCFTHMQLADFLTKSVGQQIHYKLIDEVMGVREMKDIERFTRRDWRGLYDEAHAKRSAMSPADNVRHDDAQGGMLKSGLKTLIQNEPKTKLVDLVNLNCMIVYADDTDDQCLVCDTIDDYLKYEQHRLNIVNQVKAEDMKEENKYYGNVIVLNRMTTMTLY